MSFMGVQMAKTHLFRDVAEVEDKAITVRPPSTAVFGPRGISTAHTMQLALSNHRYYFYLSSRIKTHKWMIYDVRTVTRKCE